MTLRTKNKCIGCRVDNGRLRHAPLCPAHGDHPLAQAFRRTLHDAYTHEYAPSFIVRDGQVKQVESDKMGPIETKAAEILSELERLSMLDALGEYLRNRWGV